MMKGVDTDKLAKNIVDALEYWQIEPSADNVRTVLGTLVNTINDAGYISETVRSLCEDEILNPEE